MGRDHLWWQSAGGHPTADALYGYRFRDTSDAYVRIFKALQLGGADAAAIRIHLDTCSACRERFLQLLQVAPAEAIHMGSDLVVRMIYEACTP